MARKAVCISAAVSYTHLDVYKRQLWGRLLHLPLSLALFYLGLPQDAVESFPDLAEEVIREYGYDHIVPTFLNTASVTNGGLNYDQKQQLKTKACRA